MHEELESLFNELNTHLGNNNPEENKRFLVRQWQRYNDWLVESERVSLEAFLKRIIREQRKIQ
jgi:hypothetical protein